MKNTPSFLGYSRVASEVTAGKVDYREQIELSTEHPMPAPGSPLYHNFLAPNQWPSEVACPGFRAVYTDYMRRMGRISRDFTSLIAEAIQLPADAFEKFFDADQQHKIKILKYPDMAELGVSDENQPAQGVGPHRDSMLLSYLLQATPHRGLQVENMRGQWIDCPPVDGTLVVAIGQSMEALTHGVCVSTTHRVLSPVAGSGPRFSMPFFQGIGLDANFDELETVGVGTVSNELREQRRMVIEKNGKKEGKVKFTLRKGIMAKTVGDALLRIRVKAYPEVGERWYPGILKAIRDDTA
jgi:isopenicillin N synthase-like dioxygenase